MSVLWKLFMSPWISPKIPTPSKYRPLDMILRWGHIYPMIDNLREWNLKICQVLALLVHYILKRPMRIIMMRKVVKSRVNALTDQGKTWTHWLKHYLSLQLYFQDQNVWIRMLVYHLRWVDIIWPIYYKQNNLKVHLAPWHIDKTLDR